ncbi:response regulator [Paenibacillus sp. CAA11]|uniref:response regulator n=1 Tax=Paenibacillus sp. CAA11 TaxID=1532905 RepID=UPI002D77FAD7|nr:response regulator [Paenibacillus sp. CAA11]
MEINRLYRESQTMNEELQVQTEELQSQAEELQAQTEELTMQAEELQILNERLEVQKAEAEESANSLDRLAKELEKSSNYKSEFLANMSHELRTPLNSMLILSQILAENQGGRLSEEEKNYASIIHSSGEDLLNLINDILDLSKVEAGQMSVEKNAVAVVELPNILRNYFQATADNKHLSFGIHCAEDVPEIIYTDEQRLLQILKNLLSNAFKFTHQGEVSLTIARIRNPKLQGIEIEGEALSFKVKDSGIGIAAEHKEGIFEAFRQADGAISRKYGGTGLGLSISLNLTRLLGGELSAESEEGVGSTFTLLLPVNAPYTPMRSSEESLMALAEVAAAEEAATSVSAGLEISGLEGGGLDQGYEILQGKTVLVVDDDIRNVYALTTALEKFKMQVLIAQNGYECLEVLTKEKVDIVLMDIMMPEMDGYQAMQEIRSTLQLSELPIIALTAKAMKEDREKSIASGANDYVSKPLDLEHVLKLMKVWLDESNITLS